MKTLGQIVAEAMAYDAGRLGVKPEDPRTKKRNKAQRAARKARRRGELR